MKCLNLGCGARFHQDWVNLDIQPANPTIRRWDLHRALPFSDGSFDVAYHSHVLEHFSKPAGLRLLTECLRVLRPGGTVRVAVPDLERIARLYLEALNQSLAGDPEARQRYDWMVLEMYDQTVREVSGGRMLEHLSTASSSEIGFVRERFGGELEGILAALRKNAASAPAASRFSDTLRRRALEFLLGPEAVHAYDHGRFRLSGEIHQWMYDRYSLGQLLINAGFLAPEVMGPAESRIPGWSSFHLDTESDGSTYKPDSLFMEATKP